MSLTLTTENGGGAEGAPSPVLAFTAYGEPKTAGSKDSGVVTRKDPVTGRRVPVYRDGRVQTFTKDSSGEKGKAWRAVVASAGQEAMEAAGFGVLDCPLRVHMVFYKPRAWSEYSKRTGELLPSAPRYPAKRPDVLKLARAVEDALTGIVWTDDARIVRGSQWKDFCRPDEPRRCEIHVWPLRRTA